MTLMLAITFLLCVFLGGSKFRLSQVLRYYMLQSLCLAGLLLSVGIAGEHEYFFGAASTLLIKVVLIPGGLLWIANKTAVSGRLTAFIKPTASYFLSAITLLLAVLAGTAIAPILGDQDLILTVTAFAAMLLGIMMMAVRRDFYSQIVGFLTLENGIAIFVIASLGVLPLTIEILTFVVIGVTALLMSLLARRFKELYAVEEFMTYGEVID